MDHLRERLKRLEQRIEDFADLAKKNPFSKTATGRSVLGEYRRMKQERERLKAAIDSRGSTYRRRRGFLKRY